MLFAEQQALLEAYLPKGVDLATVPVLGPINALKWELKDFEGFPFDLDVEEWNVEDELVFLELSCKVERQAGATGGVGVRRAARAAQARSRTSRR